MQVSESSTHFILICIDRMFAREFYLYSQMSSPTEILSREGLEFDSLPVYITLQPPGGASKRLPLGEAGGQLRRQKFPKLFRYCQKIIKRRNSKKMVRIAMMYIWWGTLISSIASDCDAEDLKPS
jgi:hypothetical protein